MDVRKKLISEEGFLNLFSTIIFMDDKSVRRILVVPQGNTCSQNVKIVDKYYTQNGIKFDKIYFILEKEKLEKIEELKKEKLYSNNKKDFLSIAGELDYKTGLVEKEAIFSIVHIISRFLFLILS